MRSRHWLVRPLSSATAVLLSLGSVTAAVPQSAANANAGWTADQSLTGRAIPCEQGKIKIFACRNVELLSYLPKDSLGQSVGNDVWGWHDSATGREFAIVGGEATAFVEVTDPVNPKYLGVLLPHDGITSHSAQSVKVYKNHAFIGYEAAEHGLQVFDLTQLRDVTKPPAHFEETAHYDGFGNAHTIALDQETGFAYVNGTATSCGSALHMIDVRVPVKPTFAGCFTEPAAGANNGVASYVHDTQCVVYRGSDQRYRGRELCFNASGRSLVIADVTDKANPKTISIATYPNVGFTHQGWLTEDQRYFFLDDEDDERAMAEQVGREHVRPRTIVFDINDLDDPVVLTEFFNADSPPATDHNLYIRGRYMYQANYQAGLRIIDVADPKHPTEVGYLYDASEEVSAWSSYPYFRNDVVAVSLDRGLLLARLLKR